MAAISSLTSVLVLSLIASACGSIVQVPPKPVDLAAQRIQAAIDVKPDATPLDKVNASAIEQTTYTTGYDPAYAKLDYPNGDVPRETGVCADVVVRAFRSGGIDLQQELHADMAARFSAYPRLWSARRPDKNIDHRRVPNLMKWFDRQEKSQPITSSAKDYLPGDVVAWKLTSGLLHIGIVSKLKVEGADRYAVVHNIGAGARLEDVLFAWKVSGHYRYF